MNFVVFIFIGKSGDSTSSTASSSKPSQPSFNNTGSGSKGIESSFCFSLVGLPLLANHGQSVWRATVGYVKGSPTRVTLKNDEIRLSNRLNDAAMALAQDEALDLNYLGFDNDFSTQVVDIQEVVIQGLVYHSILMLDSGSSLASFPSDSLYQFKASAEATLSKLHGHGVIHRDVRLINFVIDIGSKNIRLIDFEFSTMWGLDRADDEVFKSLVYSEMQELRSFF